MNIKRIYAIVYKKDMRMACNSTPKEGFTVKTKDKPLCVLCRGRVGAEFGSQLLGRLHQEASACAVQTDDGEISLLIFDTYAPAQGVFSQDWPEGARVVLYSNHPTGNMEPSDDDLRNLASMPEGTELSIICGRRCVKWNGRQK